MIGKVIYDLLSADTTVNNLVAARIYPIIVPQNTDFPVITYEVVSTEYLEVKGFQKIADNVRIQINVFANTYDNIEAIATAIKSVLDYKNGFVNNTVRVDYIEPTGESDGNYDQELKLFHRILSYEVSIHQPYTI